MQGPTSQAWLEKDVDAIPILRQGTSFSRGIECNSCISNRPAIPAKPVVLPCTEFIRWRGITKGVVLTGSNVWKDRAQDRLASLLMTRFGVVIELAMAYVIAVVVVNIRLGKQ